MKILPFNAIRPKSNDFAKRITAPPYDIVTRKDASELIKDNKHSFININHSDIFFDKEEQYSNKVYDYALGYYNQLKDDNILIKESKACYYLYKISNSVHQQYGIAALFSLEDYKNQFIIKHENTLKEKETDRTNHIFKLKAQTGLPCLTFEDNNDFNIITDSTSSALADYDFVDSYQTRHQLWIIDEKYNQMIIDYFEKIQKFYIIDGHHRTAAALNVLNQQSPTNDSYNYFLAVIFPASQLHTGCCNRLLTKLNIDADILFDKIQNNFEISETPINNYDIKIFYSNKWTFLKYKYPFIHALDSIASYQLQKNIFELILNIKDPRIAEEIIYYQNSIEEKFIENQIKENNAKIAFVLRPPEVKDVIKVAKEGNVMPPKSTWFWPKICDGLLCYEYENI